MATATVSIFRLVRAARSWLFLYRGDGRLREMGLGGLAKVPLGMARTFAAEARAALALGLDPIAERDRRKQELREKEAGDVTFGSFADRFLGGKGPGWRNKKHGSQWKMTLEVYAAPLRGKPLGAIRIEDVLSVLMPIWNEKAETASRLRGRIERVLDAAQALGHIEESRANPARWKGHLDQLLPKRQKLTRGHHAAMRYGEVPAFVQALRERPAVASLALQFAILTAARSGELLGARWAEIDTDEKVWTVPKERMNAKREHRVPLSDRAVEIFGQAKKLAAGEFIFPGQRPRCPLSGMSMEMLLRRMKIEGATVHGFRPSFRDWAGDATHFPREVAEAALANVVGDKAEQAYRRGDALDKRRKLMDDGRGSAPQGHRAASLGNYPVDIPNRTM